MAQPIPITEGTLYDLILDVPPAILKHYELMHIHHDYYVTTRVIPFLSSVCIRPMMGDGVQAKYRALTFGSRHYGLRFIGTDTEYKKFLDEYNNAPESNMITNELENNLVDDILTAAKEYDDNRKDKTFPEEEDRPPYGWIPAPLPKYRPDDHVWFMYNNRAVTAVILYGTATSEYKAIGSHHNISYYLQSTLAGQLPLTIEEKLFPTKQSLLDSL